jgi:hypothetical protein
MTGVLACALPSAARTADYPINPIRMVLAQAAVGNAGIVARAG